MDNKYKIILASNSPRRKELLAGLDIAFEVVVKEGIDETYPENLPHVAFAERANTSCRHGSKFDNFRETTQLQRDNRSDIQGVERCRNQLLC